MAYDLDRLGWFQFQQLCTRLMELDSGIPEQAWTGEADRRRFARVEARRPRLPRGPGHRPGAG